MTGPSGDISFCFHRISVFPSAAPRGNFKIIGKQNELFPSGPVIKCLVFPYANGVDVWQNSKGTPF